MAVRRGRSSADSPMAVGSSCRRRLVSGAVVAALTHSLLWASATAFVPARLPTPFAAVSSSRALERASPAGRAVAGVREQVAMMAGPISKLEVEPDTEHKWYIINCATGMEPVVRSGRPHDNATMPRNSRATRSLHATNPPPLHTAAHCQHHIRRLRTHVPMRDPTELPRPAMLPTVERHPPLLAPLPPPLPCHHHHHCHRYHR